MSRAEDPHQSGSPLGLFPWQAWRDSSAAFQTAATEHAEAEGTSRVEVEMAVKKAVRHPEPAQG
jgi:hypothetical protein